MSSEADQHKPATLETGHRRRDLLAIWVLYLLAIAAGWATLAASANLWPELSLWWQLVLANVSATLVVFVGSLLTGNSSCYDAYWSVAPPLVALVLAVDQGFDHPRQLLVLLVVWCWGLRLTRNWAYGWTGFDHEDWRYRQLAEQTGRWWWPVSLLGIHGFPTLMILLGSRGMVPVTSAAGDSLNLLDGLALLLGLGATWLCHIADQQLHAFRASRASRSEHVDAGVWAWCRHPNYLGEISFWISIWLFALAAGDDGWSWLGPAAMLALFVGISIPMIERKLEADKPGYADYRSRTPMLLPRPRSTAG